MRSANPFSDEMVLILKIKQQLLELEKSVFLSDASVPWAQMSARRSCEPYQSIAKLNQHASAYVQVQYSPLSIHSFCKALLTLSLDKLMVR